MGSDAEDEKKDVENEKLKWSNVSVIAKPLAGKKLNKKALKIVKKASKVKQCKRGVKEVVKSIRKGQKGLCLIAGNISPIDVISHLPILCEEMDVPYIYIPSKEDLGTASATKRPTSCMLIMREPSKVNNDANEDYEKFKKDYDDMLKEVKEFVSTVVFS